MAPRPAGRGSVACAPTFTLVIILALSGWVFIYIANCVIHFLAVIVSFALSVRTDAVTTTIAIENALARAQDIARLVCCTGMFCPDKLC